MNKLEKKRILIIRKIRHYWSKADKWTKQHFETFRAWGTLIAFFLIPLTLIQTCREIQDLKKYIATTKLDLSCEILRDSFLVTRATNNSDYIADDIRFYWKWAYYKEGSSEGSFAESQSKEMSYNHKNYSSSITHPIRTKSKNLFGQIKLTCRNCETTEYWIHLDNEERDSSFIFLDESGVMVVDSLSIYTKNKKRFLNRLFPHEGRIRLEKKDF